MSEAPWKTYIYIYIEYIIYIYIYRVVHKTTGPCPPNQAAGSRKGLHELVNFGIAFQDSLFAEVKVVLDPELIRRDIRLKQLYVY